jgi:hypothetical protein
MPSVTRSGSATAGLPSSVVGSPIRLMVSIKPALALSRTTPPKPGSRRSSAPSP